MLRKGVGGSIRNRFRPLFCKETMKILIAILVLVITAPALADSRTDSVDKLFAQFAKPDSPGCAVGIYQNGQVVYKKAYGMAEMPTPVEIEAVALRWRPYCTVASWYLWRSLETITTP